MLRRWSDWKEMRSREKEPDWCTVASAVDAAPASTLPASSSCSSHIERLKTFLLLHGLLLPRHLFKMLRETHSSVNKS